MATNNSNRAGGNLCPKCGGSLLPSKFPKRGKAQVYCSNFRRPGNPCKYTGDAAGATVAVAFGVGDVIPILTTMSAEQSAIITHAETSNRNEIYEALAGTGKTTVMVQLVRVLTGRGLSVQCLAFAKRDGETLSARCMGKATVNTSNSAGFRILGNYARRNGFRIGDVNAYIPFRMMEQRMRAEGLITKDEGGHEIWQIARPTVSAICELVDKARQTLPLSAVNPELPQRPTDADYAELAARFGTEIQTEEWPVVLAWCSWLFAECANLNNLKVWGTDFTNQVFLPSYYNMAPDTTFDRVLVDEAQDQNYTNRRIAELHVRKGTGRIIAVGDRHQAIYGWRGADADALDQMAALMERLGGVPKRFPLTLCRRCAKSIIRVAQTIVPTIQALPDAPEGEVSHIPTDDGFVQTLVKTKKGLVLCRANAPAISMCLRLLSQGVPAALVRSDIVGQLIRLIEKAAGDAGDDCPIPEVLFNVQQWADGELAKLAKRCNGDKLAQIVRDKADAINALSSGEEIKTAGDVKRRIDRLFPAGMDKQPIGERSAKMVLFSTVHGAKGGEAHTVYLYSPEAYKACLWDMVWSDATDRDNVLYVAITRAEVSLVFVGKAPTLQRMSAFGPNGDGPDDE